MQTTPANNEPPRVERERQAAADLDAAIARAAAVLSGSHLYHAVGGYGQPR